MIRTWWAAPTFDRVVFALFVAVPMVVLSLVLWVAATGHAHADPQPALDRQLVERMTRALEAQASATQQLVRVTERCNK